MSTITGQDIRSICWPSFDGSRWLTECAPLQWDHEMSEVFDWPAVECEEPLPADAEIAAGRVCSFDSIEDFIADLKLPD